MKARAISRADANGASDTSIGPLSGKAFTPNAALASTSDAVKWMFEVTDVATFDESVDDLLLICQYEIATSD